jgi:flagellar motor switch/type III secretory pathway protein FliN
VVFSGNWLDQGAPRQVQIEWSLSSALTTALTAAQQAPKAAPTTKAPSADVPSNFDLLMNIDLDVTLRFWGRNILLREILELGAGSVLELDREIQDAADLLLDGELVPVKFVPTTRTFHIAFAGDIEYAVLLAIERMLNCKK